MLISHSDELYEALLTCKLLKKSPEYWWPNYGTFEVLIGTVNRGVKIGSKKAA